MNHPWQVVVASTDATHTRTLTDILNRQGILPITVQSVQEFDAILARESVGLVFCDSKLADGDYREMVAAAAAANSRAKIVITSRFPDWDEYLEATQWGAFDVIPAPCRPQNVEWVIVQAKRADRVDAAQLPTLQTPILARSAAGRS